MRKIHGSEIWVSTQNITFPLSKLNTTSFVQGAGIFLVLPIYFLKIWFSPDFYSIISIGILFTMSVTTNRDFSTFHCNKYILFLYFWAHLFFQLTFVFNKCEGGFIFMYFFVIFVMHQHFCVIIEEFFKLVLLG